MVIARNKVAGKKRPLEERQCLMLPNELNRTNIAIIILETYLRFIGKAQQRRSSVISPNAADTCRMEDSIKMFADDLSRGLSAKPC